MASLIDRVRELTAAGTAEYTIGSTAYWSDEQIQTALDRARLDLWDAPLRPAPRQVGGTVVWTDYASGYANLESTLGGTALFEVRDAVGNLVSGTAWSADYARGVVTFAASTGGSAYVLNARAYDVYGAAASVLDGWAAYLARQFDFATDGQSFKVSQQREALATLARQYRSQASGYGQGGLSAEWDRSDTA
jgi:hypothetical protein